MTDARYANYKDYDGVSFPSRIEIFRPQEEYDITLNMLKLEINKPLRDDQFALEQPPGAEVVHLDKPQPQSSAMAPPPVTAISIFTYCHPERSEDRGVCLRRQWTGVGKNQDPSLPLGMTIG